MALGSSSEFQCRANTVGFWAYDTVVGLVGVGTADVLFQSDPIFRVLKPSSKILGVLMVEATRPPTSEALELGLSQSRYKATWMSQSTMNPDPYIRYCVVVHT